MLVVLNTVAVIHKYWGREPDSLGGGLTFTIWSLCLKHSSNVGASSISLWVVVASATAAFSGSALFNVFIASSQCWQMHKYLCSTCKGYRKITALMTNFYFQKRSVFCPIYTEIKFDHLSQWSSSDLDSINVWEIYLKKPNALTSLYFHLWSLCTAKLWIFPVQTTVHNISYNVLTSSHTVSGP